MSVEEEDGSRVVYVDHAATTPVRPEVLEVMLHALREQWGNPSSLHEPGRRARSALDAARRTVADVLGCAPEEIVFTASGSEAANLAIKGVAFAAPPHRRQLITSRVEHHAVLNTCRWLARHRGFQLTELDVDQHGVVDLQQLADALSERTALVSIMYANNEVGTLQPIPLIARLAHAHGVPLHTDAVQAAGTQSLDVQALDVDLLSISGHKLYAPKGIAALYVRHGTRLQAQVQGGEQERGRRAGTENVPSIAALAAALSLAQAERAVAVERLGRLSQGLLDALPAQVPGCRVTGHPLQRVPGHASFTFEGVEIASVLRGLDRQDIWASSGSACTSASAEPSHVLLAMRVPRAHLYGALRVTFGLHSTAADVDALLGAVPALVAAARERQPVAA